MTHATYSTDYWYYEKALSDEQCESLLNIKRQHDLQSATIDAGQIDEKIRKTEVCFTREQWVYDLVLPHLHNANTSANWNFDIDYCEDAQFTEYKNGGHYTWHKDTMPMHMTESLSPNFKGKIRKLSTTIVLSDDDEYEGADFELINSLSVSPNSNSKIEILKEPAFRKKGTIIFFPSHVFHRVTPITSGVRNSLVFWWLGPPFK